METRTEERPVAYVWADEAKYDAARKAADAVLAEKLGDTIAELREEAFRLFDDMIDVAVVA